VKLLPHEQAAFFMQIRTPRRSIAYPDTNTTNMQFLSFPRYANLATFSVRTICAPWRFLRGTTLNIQLFASPNQQIIDFDQDNANIAHQIITYKSEEEASTI